MQSASTRLLCTLICLTAAAPAVAQTAKSVAAIVTDQRGEGLPELACKLASVHPGAYDRDSTNCTFHDAPYGLHVLTVETPGFRSHRQTVPVYQPIVDVRVTLPIGDIAHIERIPGSPPFGTTLDDDLPYARSRIRGRLPGSVGRDSLLIRIVPLFGNSGLLQDAKVGDDGRFQASGMAPGDYVLLLMRERPGASPAPAGTRFVSIPSYGSLVDLGDIE